MWNERNNNTYLIIWNIRFQQVRIEAVPSCWAELILLYCTLHRVFCCIRCPPPCLPCFLPTAFQEVWNSKKCFAILSQIVGWAVLCLAVACVVSCNIVCELPTKQMQPVWGTYDETASGEDTVETMPATFSWWSLKRIDAGLRFVWLSCDVFLCLHV